MVTLLKHSPSVPKLDNQFANGSYGASGSAIARMDPSQTVDDNERKLASRTRPTTVGGKTTQQTQTMDSRSTAGTDWFHLPRTNLTPQLKRDLQLLSMRSAWDPKRHYKKDNRKPSIPEYSQIGTIIEGPTEHYSSRIVKRVRKQTFVEDITAAEGLNGRFKKKSVEIQASKANGRQAFYNNLKQRRSKRSVRP
ncbi:dTDP-fucopyranose mutase [Xanthoria calcicola]